MSISAAIDWAERELVRTEGLKEAVAVLQQLRSAEGLAQSLETRAHDARMALEKAGKDLQVVNAQIEENKAQAEKWAANLTASAQEKAKAIEAKASETAEKMLASANARREEVEAKASEAQKRAAEAQEALKQAQSEHDSLSKKMQEMKALAQTLAGS